MAMDSKLASLFLILILFTPQILAGKPCPTKPKYPKGGKGKGPIVLPPIIGKPPITLPPVIGKPPITLPPVIGKPPITLPPVIGKPPITLPPVPVITPILPPVIPTLPPVPVITPKLPPVIPTLPPVPVVTPKLPPVIPKLPPVIPKLPPVIPTLPPAIPKLPPVIPTLPPVPVVTPILPPVLPTLPPVPVVTPILPPVTGTPTTPSGPGCAPGKATPSKPPSSATCPIDTLKLAGCVDILGATGLIHLGDPEAKCCPVLEGLVDLEAAVCLCTTIKLSTLNLGLTLPIALNLLVTCGKTAPEGFTCPS